MNHYYIKTHRDFASLPDGKRYENLTRYLALKPDCSSTLLLAKMKDECHEMQFNPKKKTNISIKPTHGVEKVKVQVKLDTLDFADWERLDELFKILELERSLKAGLHVCLPPTLALLKRLEDETVSIKHFTEFKKAKHTFEKAQKDEDLRN